MNEIQKNYIGWFLIALLVIGHNNIMFLRMDKQENEDNIKALSESMEDFKVLLDSSQSRLEKRIFDFKKSSFNYTGDCDTKYKKLAKLLLLTVKMKSSLLQEARFDNHISEMKSLIIDLGDQDIEDAVQILGNIKEINSLPELRLSFEKIIDTISYNKSSLFKRITANWIRVKNKNDPLRIKWSEIEDSINDHDWQGITAVVDNLTDAEFKPWLSKLSDFVLAYNNILTVYNHLLQYIS
ncbi:MAG: hypothetical protein QWI36_01655 [Wolbachia endosymbiont of Tyrophagus putrescentiae]|nr:hypothetical protein [Wolbachia endosymbiont of Tyrophagus putrescentiae]